MPHVEGGMSLSYDIGTERVSPFSKKLEGLLPKEERVDAGYRKDVDYRFTENNLYCFWI